MAVGFGRDARLRTRGEFVAVETGGRRVSGRFLILLGKPNGLDADRLGIIASRRVGGAIERNRAKRRLREMFRRRAPQHGPRALDVVAIARPDLVSAPFADVQTDFLAALTKLRGPR
jgi:ribonuclease P protein component